MSQLNRSFLFVYLYILTIFYKPLFLRATFPKQQKLKSSKDIKSLFEDGNSITKYPIKLLWLPRAHPQTKAGFAVAKRNFKSAVTRNRIKRLMREAYRTEKKEIIGQNKMVFNLLFIYIGKDVADFKTIDKAMQVGLLKLPVS